MKLQRRFIGFAVLLWAAIFLVTGCDDSGDSAEPLTGSVTITGISKVGEVLTADVTKLGGNGTVSYQWKRGTQAEVEADTVKAVIAATPTYLLVPADEGKVFKVTVTRAGYAGSVTSNATIPILDAMSPAAASVTISPGSATVPKGGTRQFTAVVIGTHDSAQTIWRVNGGKSGTSISESGLLIVAADETAQTLTVTAASALDTTKSATATVTVSGAAGSGGDAKINNASLNWNLVSPSPFSSSYIRAIAYGGGRFVAVGDNGPGTPPWPTPSRPSGSATETSPPVAVSVSWSSPGTSSTAYSMDGITWNSVTNNVSSFDYIRGIAYGDGKFIAVGSSGTATRSGQWTAQWRSYPYSSYYWEWGWTQTAAQATWTWTGKIVYSTNNGASWTAVTDKPFGSDGINGIAYGGVSGSGKFVAVGDAGKMAYSTNGTSWTQVGNTAFGTSDIKAIAYGGGKFVAVGANGKMAYSTDGTSWTSVATSTFGTSNINGIAYRSVSGSEKFVAVGDAGKMAHSTDGIIWTAVAAATGSFSFGTDSINAIAYGGGVPGLETFIAVGANRKMAHSADGITWTQVQVTKFPSSAFGSPNNSIRGIAYGGGRFVAGGDAGQMLYSNTDFEGTWRRDLSAGYPCTIKFTNFDWEYAENDNVLSKGTWITDGTVTAPATGTLIFKLTQIKRNGVLVNVPAEYAEVKINATSYNISTKSSNRLIISAPAFTVSGIWENLAGVYTK